jgi:hypothetical protein
MATAAGLSQFAAQLQARGLHVTWEGEGHLSVANPVSTALVQSVLCEDNRYLTGWGYEIGLQGEEGSAAERLAFLLGVPCPRHEPIAMADEQPFLERPPPAPLTSACR